MSLVLSLVGGLVGADYSTAHAESNAPEATAAHRPAPALQLYTTGVQMAPLLPDLLGFTEPKTYLLLLQNNHELRPTGGFITAVGQITLDAGRVAELVVNDSYDIARHDIDHPIAPEPMRRFMQIDLLFLRDVNWSPDFPTTARLASSIYAQDAGVQADGVITADLRAVQLLVDALGPLEIPGSDVVLTGENVIDEVMHFWDRPPTSEVDPDVETESVMDREGWLGQRKDFIPLVAEAVNTSLQNGDFNPLLLLNALTASLNERAIQVWLNDPTAASFLAQQGWDGGLQPAADADFVALVDMNMGYNKVNAVLERALSHHVTWPDGPTASAQATVTVTYDHPLDVVDEACIPNTDFRTIASYTELMERCYFGYVRLYAPGDSELIALEGVEEDSVVAQPGERGTTTFGGYFVLKPGEQHVVTFTYTLPPTITLENYRLILQRQSGTSPLPVDITVDDTAFEMTLVDGRLMWHANPPTVTVSR